MKISKHLLGLPGISAGMSSNFQTVQRPHPFDVETLEFGYCADSPLPRQDSGYAVLSRAYDIAFAVVVITLLLPLLVILAIAIKASSKGPVFFRQQRYGLNGKLFSIYKFRTMSVDHCDASGVQQTVKNDPRVTSIGRLLRRTNFDEVPQIFNILKGEMSVVGPRPHVPGMLASGQLYEDFDPRYMGRHVVKPGLTGLAQVNGYRGETTDAGAARMRLEYDLAYVRRQSMPLDILITVQTFWKEFFRGSSGY
ncbi:lipopolysaccharide/colanic/teichoic acid biosynthesis glycosyltransferase [Yoonia maricola]|uniref:Lipopolysaccharide/colanic/teichoic acid biosynthesis glycosyltransferase n=1 Tax=Yoonia maricola TaxID=420999 RepID=A0A2M8WP27_9RHOB|nr:sugar transferase [Yoonia maricola]PJI92668.1 lipopolysaccharide/colanic/teichoic acid biosynthesis glycosyltransferase [Yoonia maricola]